MDLALNNLERLICHKTHQTKPNLKVNIVPWLEFELAFFKAAVKHFSHYAMGTPSKKIKI